MIKVPEALNRSAPWIHTLATYGLAQVVIAGGAFIRIPLLIFFLGPSGYGTIIMVSGIAILVTAITDAIAQAARVEMAESLERKYILLDSYNRIAATIMIMISIVFLIVIIILGFVGSGMTDMIAAFCCMLGCSLGILGGPSRGLLEAQGLTARVNSFQLSTTIGGLPLLLLILLIWPSTATAGIATGIGMSLPAIFCLIAAKKQRKKFSKRTGDYFVSIRQMSNSPKSKNILNMLTWTWANTLNYAFDAAIVGVIIGTVAAGEFGLASRVMTLAMMLSLGLNPLITTTVSKWRSQGNLKTYTQKIIKMSLVMALIGTILSVVGVALGPFIAEVLSGGEVVADQNLFIALGAFSILSATTSPLMAAFSGRGGVKFRSYASVISGCLNFILSIVLTITIGISGPAIASTISLIMLSLVLVVKWRKDPKILMATYQENNA